FVPQEEPGPYVGAPPKEVRLAETETVLKGEAAAQAVRTVICREVVPGPKKDRWHPLFTTSLIGADEVLSLFRARQHHEQAGRGRCTRRRRRRWCAWTASRARRL